MRLVRLELVAVDDDDQVPDRLVCAGLERLPVLALLELAVAGHHDHAPAAAEERLGPGHAAALGDPHAERARVGLDARHADVRMPVEPALAAQPQQPLGGRTPNECSTAYSPGTSWPLEEK